ncbi:tetratricopeptide repeat protein [Rapidithrix thailandica]|uniref:Tetratricopeptide repeat protein n=1 Tax=Rapidithrix thailandica TaxID=413964 RepID=A0AAW9S3Z5_9BACT
MSRYFLHGFGWMVMLLLFGCQSDVPVKDQLVDFREPTNRDFKKQLEFIRQALEKYPEKAELYYQKALINFEIEKYNQALRDIDDALELDTRPEKYTFFKGKVLYQKGALQEALKELHKVENTEFDDFELYQFIGVIYHQLGKEDQALTYLQKANNFVPGLPNVLYALGAIYLKKKEKEKARKFLFEAIKSEPTYTEAYIQLIQYYQEELLPQKALEVADTAVRLCKQDAFLYSSVGKTLSLLNKPDSAKYWFDKAVKLEEGLWEASENLAEYHRKRKNYLLAEGYLKSAVEKNTDLSAPCFKLGFLYEYYLRDLKKAQEMYGMALKRDLENEEYQTAINRIERKIRFSASEARNRARQSAFRSAIRDTVQLLPTPLRTIEIDEE